MKVAVGYEELTQLLNLIESRSNAIVDDVEKPRIRNELRTIAYDAWCTKKLLDEAEPYAERLTSALRLSADEERMRREIYARMYVASQSCDLEERRVMMNKCAADLLRLYGEGVFADIFEDTEK